MAPDFGALGAHAVSDGLLRVPRHEAFQFCLSSFMFEKSRVCSSERAGEFRPRIGGAHVDDVDRFDTRLRRINPEQGGGLAVLDAAPELSLRSDNEVLVKGIRRGPQFQPTCRRR